MAGMMVCSSRFAVRNSLQIDYCMTGAGQEAAVGGYGSVLKRLFVLRFSLKQEQEQRQKAKRTTKDTKGHKGSEEQIRTTNNKERIMNDEYLGLPGEGGDTVSEFGRYVERDLEPVVSAGKGLACISGIEFQDLGGWARLADQAEDARFLLA